MHAQLKNRALIAISGETAGLWLQDLITLDMKLLDDQSWHGAALLSPQGKILFDFLIAQQSDTDFLIDMRADQASAFVQRLTLYRLRAKIEIKPPEPIEVMVTTSASQEARLDRRFRTPVYRTTHKSISEQENRAAYDAARIENGIAESSFDYALGEAFPHDINLDQTGGISFRKGCYVGQEVISRMHHRGSARRRLLIVSTDREALIMGADLIASMSPDREIVIGTIGTSIGSKALALCRLDRVSDALAQNAPMTIADAFVTVTLPNHVTYNFDILGKSSD